MGTVFKIGLRIIREKGAQMVKEELGAACTTSQMVGEAMIVCFPNQKSQDEWTARLPREKDHGADLQDLPTSHILIGLSLFYDRIAL